MGIVTPNGNVRLMSVNFDSTYKDVVDFASVSAQTTHFSAKTLFNYDTENFTYIQKDSYLRINANADTLYSCNYVMYQNTAFTSKWFYAFIDRIEWLSDNTSAVYISTDVWQTWQFDTALKPSFVEREHSVTDVVGENTIPEGLELGDYLIAAETQTRLNSLSIVVSTTISDIERDLSVPWKAFTKTVEPGGQYMGIYSGSAYLKFPCTSAGISNLNVFLQTITEAGASDVVSSIFMCPSNMLFENKAGTDAQPQSGHSTKSLTFILPTAPASLDGYTPLNNKMKTFPYTSLYVHNNNGSGAVYPFENFDGSPTFKVYGNPHANPTFKITPKNYKLSSTYSGANVYNYDESLTISGYPLCNWSYDAYTAWLAQSGASTAISTLTSLAVAGAGIMAGVASGGTLPVVMGVMGASASLAKTYEASLQPPQSRGNAGSGGANNAIWTNDFFMQTKTIKAEYAKRIDEFLSMYGYRTNLVKVPNTNSRPTWNYVKTNDVNLLGALPMPDMARLKAIFNQGVTIWRSEANVGNYSLGNGVS